MASNIAATKPNFPKMSTISMFSASDQCCFDQYTRVEVRRKDLRSIGCTVAMVTTILLRWVA